MKPFCLLLVLCCYQITTNTSTKATTPELPQPITYAFYAAHAGYPKKEADLKKDNASMVIDIHQIVRTKQVERDIPYFGNIKYIPLPKKAVTHEKILLVRGKPLGYVGYYYTPHHCHTVARIVGISIKTGYHKKGYGSQLMQHTLDQMEKDKIQKVFLKPETNSISFFQEKFGFQKTTYDGWTYLQLELYPE